MEIAKIVLESVSIFFSITLSVIAIVISIKSIKLQNKSQNINASIQLFDKRFEVYNFISEVWFLIGYLFGILEDEKLKVCFQELLKKFKEVKHVKDVVNKFSYVSDNTLKYSRMSKCLFSKDISNEIDELFTAFEYVNFGIHNNAVYYSIKEYDKYFQELFESNKNSEKWMEKLRDYIVLSDIKRNDI